MAINTTLTSVSTTAASNGPAGSDQRTLADDGLRQYVSFIKQLKVSASLASGNTVTPPDTANVFLVSGVTTINTIASTNSWDGRDIYFLFAGILTLTHSSNLALPGAANIVTAANDVAHFIQTGTGAWRCDQYQKADGSIILSGNNTVNSPVSGNNFNITTPAGGASVATTSSGAYTVLSWTDGTRTGALTTNASFGTIFNTTSAHGIALFAAGNSALEITSGRNATFKAPTGTNSLTVEQFSGSVYSIVAESTVSGNPVQNFISNLSNTASSDSRQHIAVAGTSAGDPYTLYAITGTRNWGIGVDNSDSDTFKIDANGVLGTTNNWFNVTTDGRLYGTALHNNAGAITGTTNQYIASFSGQTPATSSPVNCTAATQTGSGKGTRVGNIVTGSLIVNVDPTVASTLTSFKFALPIAANFTSGLEVSGSAVQNLSSAAAATVGICAADTVNDVIVVTFFCGTDAAARDWFINYQYEIV